jgi:hypothetical protein
MAKVFIRLETTGFKQACEDLAKISGKSFKEVVRVQTGLVLRAMIKKTPAASKKKIAERAQKISQLEIGYLKNPDNTFLVNRLPKAPDKRFYRQMSEETGKMTLYVDDPSRRWNNKRWNGYQEAKARWTAKLANVGERILAARGYAKQTWLKIASDINLEQLAKASRFVYKAKSRGKRKYDNGDGKQKESGDTFFTLLVNKYRWFGMIKFKRKFQAVLDARRQAFMIEMEHGLFDDIKMRAKRYPGLFAKPPTKRKKKVPDPPEA